MPMSVRLSIGSRTHTINLEIWHTRPGSLIGALNRKGVSTRNGVQNPVEPISTQSHATRSHIPGKRTDGENLMTVHAGIFIASRLLQEIHMRSPGSRNTIPPGQARVNIPVGLETLIRIPNLENLMRSLETHMTNPETRTTRGRFITNRP